MQDIWNTIIVPILWLVASLGAVLAVFAIFTAFFKVVEWLMEKIGE